MQNYGYFDDFRLLNVTHVRLENNIKPQKIITPHYYFGLMQGQVILQDKLIDHPFVYLTPKGVTVDNAWLSPEKSWRDNFYIECCGERISRLFASFGAQQFSRIYEVHNPDAFEAVLRELQKLFVSESPINHVRQVLCVEELAALLFEQLVPNFQKTDKHLDFEKLLLEISLNPGRKWDFSAEAERLNMTLRHWNRLFTTYAKQSPHRFVINCRLRQARKLLVSGMMPIKQIAFECGFDNASEFSRFFKKNTGMSPGACRKLRRL